MAAELETPIDELSGLPLPIAPHDVLPTNNPDIANWHHHWHPSTDTRLLTPGGLAIRHSRVQLVEANHHNMGDRHRGKLTYHDYYVGPPLPINENDEFAKCVLACAGYIPYEAIDLSSGEPKRVTMTQRQMDILRMPGEFVAPNFVQRKIMAQRSRVQYRKMKDPDQELDPTQLGLGSPQMSEDEFIEQNVTDLIERQKMQAEFTFRHLTYRYEAIRDFFRAYAIKQNLSHVRKGLINEFLLTKDPEQRIKIGRFLLSNAVAVATDKDSVKEAYKIARNEGLLHPAMPAEPQLLVQYKLGTLIHRNKLLPRLAEELQAHAA